MLREKSLILAKSGLYPTNDVNWPFINQHDPMSVIADNDPKIFNKVARKVLVNDLVSERNQTIRDLSSHNSNIVCAWLYARQPGEKTITVDNAGGAKENGFFSRGEVSGVKTVVKIG